MRKNTDLIVLALLLALVLVLVAVLELLHLPAPAFLGTAGTVLLGGVGALATGSRTDTSSSTSSELPDLPAGTPVIEGPR